MTTALVCIALLGLLVFGLGFGVSTMRGRTNTAAGSSGDPTDSLHKLIRAHGNTAEYAAMLAVLIFLVGSRSPATWALWCMGIATASRVLIAVGSSYRQRSRALIHSGSSVRWVPTWLASRSVRHCC